MATTVRTTRQADFVSSCQQNGPTGTRGSGYRVSSLTLLLTLLGAAGEALGYDRHLKSNTVKRRTHSLFRQGCMLYDLIPTMPESRLRPLMETFTAILEAQPLFRKVFGAI